MLWMGVSDGPLQVTVFCAQNAPQLGSPSGDLHISLCWTVVKGGENGGTGISCYGRKVKKSLLKHPGVLSLHLSVNGQGRNTACVIYSVTRRLRGE